MLYQFVSFLRDGEVVKMSKRAGTIVTLDELIDEVGVDAARFTLLPSSNDSAMNFDIELVKRQTMDNPVYYVQYGHARIASILRKARARASREARSTRRTWGCCSRRPSSTCCARSPTMPAQIAAAADLRAPHRLTHAAQDLAGAVPPLLRRASRGRRVGARR